jgi:chromosome segregation ATPase
MSDSLERLRHELEGLPPAIVERLARIRAAAEELMSVLAAEWQRFDRLSDALKSAAGGDKKLRKQADELLRRLRAHIDEMRQLAERVARAAREWEQNPLGADARLGDLVSALTRLTHGDFARNHEALVDELGTLLARGVPGGV